MAHTYEELRGKTLAELRNIAKEIDSEHVKGYSQLNKEHLLPAVCLALGIEVHEHHAVTGIDKTAIKARMRDLRQRRTHALEMHDHEQLKSLRREIHHLNHQIRAHMT
jgi:DNA-binding IclR family transcriptional regulator